eukprot:TRINITY_DN17638_c0_g6_i6.p1 TRINITY_DN17638_c0_g6~~TRINITY_DN17638_c0_g6_i6.p1  ORF type:complete len:520 (-),score=137.10 TRINITY_DN17638_c0_g6_i6:304-1863(-)
MALATQSNQVFQCASAQVSAAAAAATAGREAMLAAAAAAGISECDSAQCLQYFSEAFAAWEALRKSAGNCDAVGGPLSWRAKRELLEVAFYSQLWSAELLLLQPRDRPSSSSSSGNKSDPEAALHHFRLASAMLLGEGDAGSGVPDPRWLLKDLCSVVRRISQACRNGACAAAPALIALRMAQETLAALRSRASGSCSSALSLDALSACEAGLLREEAHCRIALQMDGAGDATDSAARRSALECARAAVALDAATSAGHAESLRLLLVAALGAALGDGEKDARRAAVELAAHPALPSPARVALCRRLWNMSAAGTPKAAFALELLHESLQVLEKGRDPLEAAERAELLAMRLDVESRRLAPAEECDGESLSCPRLREVAVEAGQLLLSDVEEPTRQRLREALLAAVARATRAALRRGDLAETLAWLELEVPPLPSAASAAPDTCIACTAKSLWLRAHCRFRLGGCLNSAVADARAAVAAASAGSAPPPMQLQRELKALELLAQHGDRPGASSIAVAAAA